MNDNTCDKDCCCYYCEDFETCGHACSNYDDNGLLAIPLHSANEAL